MLIELGCNGLLCAGVLKGAKVKTCLLEKGLHWAPCVGRAQQPIFYQLMREGTKNPSEKHHSDESLTGGLELANYFLLAPQLREFIDEEGIKFIQVDAQCGMDEQEDRLGPQHCGGHPAASRSS